VNRTIRFEGWHGDCFFTVLVVFVKKILVDVRVKYECYNEDYRLVEIKCSDIEDYNEIVTECFNRALDIASHLLSAGTNVKTKQCRIPHKCLS
jgi:hypothetical protein